jgi:MFS family permease
MLTYAMLSPILALLFLESSCCLLPAANQMKHFIFGLFLSVYSLMQIVALPLWARASAGISKKNILRLAYCGNAVGYGVCALGVYLGSVYPLFVGAALAGLMGANIPTMQALISESAPRCQWSRFYSLFGAVVGLAFILGPQITGLCLHSFSAYQVCLGIYLLCAAVSLLNCGLIGFISDTEARGSDVIQSGAKDPQLLLPAARENIFASPKFFSFSPDLQRILLFQFCICMGWYSFIKFFQVYLIERLHCTTVWSCYGISYLGLCCTFWQGLRFSCKPELFNFRYFFHLALVLMGGSFLGFMVIDSIVGVTIAVCCLACSYAMLTPSILTLLIGKGPLPAEYKTSAYHSVQALGKILAPLMAGFVLSFTSLATAFICALLVGVAAVILLRSPESFS